MLNVRKHLLIDPKFQFRFAFLFTGLIALIGLTFGIYLMLMFDTAGKHALIINNPPALLALQDAKREFLIALVLVQSFLLVLSFLSAIIFSHRISGPLYKLKVAMAGLRQGVLDRHIVFREKDYFKNLANEFNKMSDAIVGRRNKDAQSIRTVIPKLEHLQTTLSGEDKAYIVETLTALQEYSRDSSRRQT